MVRRLKLRTLQQCAWDVSAAHSDAEGIELWLSERPGVELVTVFHDAGGWRAVLRRDGLMVAMSESQANMSAAIVVACRAYELTRPPSEYDATWTRGEGWKPPASLELPTGVCPTHQAPLANLAFFSCGCRAFGKK